MRHSHEDCPKILRQVDLDPTVGTDVAKAGRSAGISHATYDTWRITHGARSLVAWIGDMDSLRPSELKSQEKENQYLKKG